jgi:uncharacterized protein (DUF4415 family)
MSNTTDNSKTEMTYEVTQEQYEAMKAKGIKDAALLKPGRYTVRRGRKLDNPEALEPKNIKVRITLYIDLDILNYFKARAEEPNAAPYQTQINNELRLVMEGKRDKQQPISLSSRQVQQIAERVAELLKTTPTKPKRKAS